MNKEFFYFKRSKDFKKGVQNNYFYCLLFCSLNLYYQSYVGLAMHQGYVGERHRIELTRAMVLAFGHR